MIGDTVEVLPSDRFPVDGVVLDGRTAADESSLTGVWVREISLRPRFILLFPSDASKQEAVTVVVSVPCGGGHGAIKRRILDLWELVACFSHIIITYVSTVSMLRP